MATAAAARAEDWRARWADEIGRVGRIAREARDEVTAAAHIVLQHPDMVPRPAIDAQLRPQVDAFDVEVGLGPHNFPKLFQVDNQIQWIRGKLIN